MRPRSRPAALRFLVPAAFVLLAGCDRDLGPETTISSFERLQSEVLDVSCVGCHTSGTPFAEESGLVLQAASSYEELVGAMPTDPAARDDGLLRVAPGEPEASLLLHKLRWDLPPTEPSYGAPMPLGGQPPTVGQVDFVRQWILEGAPREGEVADPELLDDATEQDVTTFPPPEVPDGGHQIHLGPFPVPPRSERELFSYQPLGNDEEIWVDRVEIVRRPNSHHFIPYYFRSDTPEGALPQPGVYRDIWDQTDGSFDPSPLAGMTWRQRIAGVQTATEERLFPEGVALRLPADVRLDLNAHYINRTDDVIYGEVYTNFHTVDPESVVHEAEALFLNNTSIQIPPHATGETTVVSRSFTFDEPRSVVTLTSHMHEKGQRFAIRKVEAGGAAGEVLYETDSWEHPDVVFFDPALELEAGEGLRSEVTYHNPTGETATFGLLSTDEMSIMLGYFYRPQ